MISYIDKYYKTLNNFLQIKTLPSISEMRRTSLNFYCIQIEEHLHIDIWLNGKNTLGNTGKMDLEIYFDGGLMIADDAYSLQEVKNILEPYHKKFKNHII